MAILTQTNATVVFSVAAAWSSVSTIPGIIPDNPYTHAVTAGLMLASAFLGFAGFTRTAQGNTLPPEVVAAVDRQAVASKAGDAIVEAAAAVVTADAQAIKAKAQEPIK